MQSELQWSGTFSMNTYRPMTEFESSRIWTTDFNEFARAHHLIRTKIGLLVGMGITVVLATRSTYPTRQSKMATVFIFTVISAISILLLLAKNMPVGPRIREDLLETALLISLHVASFLLGPLELLTVSFSESFLQAALIFIIYTRATQSLFGAIIYTPGGVFWSLRILTAIAFFLLTMNRAECQLLCHNHADLRQHLLNLRQPLLTWLPSKYLAPDAVGMCVLARQTIQVAKPAC
eukprot:jgi/Botrbrau1/18703/Bobra.0386s0029.1